MLTVVFLFARSSSFFTVGYQCMGIFFRHIQTRHMHWPCCRIDNTVCSCRALTQRDMKKKLGSTPNKYKKSDTNSSNRIALFSVSFSPSALRRLHVFGVDSYDTSGFPFFSHAISFSPIIPFSVGLPIGIFSSIASSVSR